MDVCLELDVQRDTLSAEAREQASGALQHALERNGHRLLPAGCEVTHRFYEAASDGGYTVVLSGPRDSQSRDITRLDELPQAYEALVQGLLGAPSSASSASTGTPCVERPTPSNSSTHAAQGARGSLAYGRIGLGASVTGGPYFGPALGLGYRYQRGPLGFEISAFDIVLPGLTLHDVSGALAELGVLVRPAPAGRSPLFFRAGVGYAKTVQRVDGTDYANSGLAADLGAGYDLDHDRPPRLFLQLDALLPAYTLHPRGIGHASAYYAPTVTLSLGVGFGD